MAESEATSGKVGVDRLVVTRHWRWESAAASDTDVSNLGTKHADFIVAAEESELSFEPTRKGDVVSVHASQEFSLADI
jgi:hypothetical protein